MKENSKNKIIKVLHKMNNGGLSFEEFKNCYKHSTERTKLLRFLTSENIKYEKKFFTKRASDFKIFLKTPLNKAIEKIENFQEENLLKSKYNFPNLINILKNKKLTPTECCEILGCKRRDYKNIIVYLSNTYPIYEEDDKEKTIGLLTI
jgi:hypothetical protein